MPCVSYKYIVKLVYPKTHCWKTHLLPPQHIQPWSPKGQIDTCWMHFPQGGYHAQIDSREKWYFAI
jgi:hypothetical protein